MLDITYFEKRLQSSLLMIEGANDCSARAAHRTFAATYRAKIASLQVGELEPRGITLS